MLKWHAYILFNIFWLCSTPLVWSQISQTMTFTLSVTIPERAEAPDGLPTLNHPSQQTTTHPFYLQPELRNNEFVYIVSYVVD
jgi:hypothetical protein